MEHETDVATPASQSSPAAENNGLSERQLAFKRGAPLPRTEPTPKPAPKRAPASKTEEAPTTEAAPERAAAATTATKAVPAPKIEPSAPKEAPPADEATTPRRRSRGGRGRGGAGRTTGTDAATTAKTEPIEATEPVESAGPDPASEDGASPAPRKRRRRGGRGRGGAGRAKTATEAEEGATAEPKKKTTRTTKPKASAATTKEPATKSSRGRANPLSAEEQVAAGGPTRALRSSRSRPARDGGRGRARREPLVVPPRVTDKLMVITEHGDRDQIAVLEKDVLVQHYVTRTGARSMVGNVYLGRVQNVLPGMEAAFVDIGRGRNGVLYAGEVNYSPEDLEGPAPRIEQVLKSGQAVMVQVTKDPMGGKGARVTAQISLPGRYLVFAPNQSLSGISRRLPDEERKRLKTIMRTIKPEGDGVIVRTAAEGASEEALTADLERLVRQWDEIQKHAKKVKAPDVLYEEPELTVRVVRDLFTDEEYRELVTDSPRVHEKVMAYVRDIAPDLASKIRLHQGKLPAFEEFRVVEQIHKALDKKVWLPSGGYLFIERTEAMTIIDVNTGKSVGKTNLEETVKNTNLEAATEVARQLRLRDIGGIIVIDFIDMLLEKNKKQVEDTMRDAVAIDKTRSQVFEIGPLGLMQVTRKRVSGGLVESFSETCPTCEGRGILINYEA
jgi:ribonuclease E